MSGFGDMILSLLKAASLAVVIYLLVTAVNIDLSGPRGKTRKLVARQLADGKAPSLPDKFGAYALAKLNLDMKEWKRRLQWARLGGHYLQWTLGRMMGYSILASLGGLAYGLLMDLLMRTVAGFSIPFVLLLLPAAAMFFVPSFLIDGKAKDTKRMIQRELPDAASLMAAEMAAGNSADKALSRLAELETPLGVLVRDAINESQSSGKPLFTRARHSKGTLFAVFARMGAPSLRAFAAQVDMVASKGAAAATDLMIKVSESLTREYGMRILEQTEKLGGTLSMQIGVFFFLPFVAVLLVPMGTSILSGLR